MNENEIIFKDEIVQFDEYFRSEIVFPIFFRVININDRYFFAQEISTGAIFPVCSFGAALDNTDKSDHYIKNFYVFSNLLYGKYFVFGKITIKNNSIGCFKLRTENMWQATEEETNEYLENAENNPDFKEKVKKLAGKNKFCFSKKTLEREITNARAKSQLVEDTILSSATSIDLKGIKEFGYDMSLQNHLGNMVDRESEIKKIIKNIALKHKSVLLVGDAGSGKTSLVEKLAFDIKNNQNTWLSGKTIVSISPTALLAGTIYRGAFEENIKKLIEFCKKYQNQVILFIDEIHALYGMGNGDGSSLDAMNMLKPYLTTGEIVIIGATTKEEYEKYLARDAAFCRRFEKIDVPVPDETLNKQILKSYLEELKSKYQLEFPFNEQETEQIISNILNATDPKNQRMVGDSVKITNPTLAKNVLEDAFTEAKYNQKKSVDLCDITFAISDCDKLSPTFRKEQITKLKKVLNATLPKPEENQKVLPFTR